MKKYDPKQLIEKLHEKDIYVIGRLVCFRDPAFSKKNSDRAVKDINGGLWREEKNNNDMTWLNPCDERNWKYIVDIAKEAVKLGFDEIQFDYVRFPDGTRSRMDFGETDFVKHEVINGFLAYARSEMPDVTLSADIFGIVCVSPGDREDIGQYLELIGKELDYISPMTYPSLYARGQIVNGIKFPNPDLEPYAVVYNTLLMAKDRLSKVEEYRADIRPYLQAYTASWLPAEAHQTYAAEQYRQQIQAVYDAGYEQWIFGTQTINIIPMLFERTTTGLKQFCIIRKKDDSLTVRCVTTGKAYEGVIFSRLIVFIIFIMVCKNNGSSFGCCHLSIEFPLFFLAFETIRFFPQVLF